MDTTMQMQVFTNPAFGEVRTINEDGKTLFCGVDIARPLAYKNIPDALTRHCRCIVKRDIPHPQNPEKEIEMLFIPEGDVYRLIAHSCLPVAQKFESWIFDEVLPSIRKTGSYETEAAKAQARMVAANAKATDAVARLLRELRLAKPAEHAVAMEILRQNGINIPEEMPENAAMDEETETVYNEMHLKLLKIAETEGETKVYSGKKYYLLESPKVREIVETAGLDARVFFTHLRAKGVILTAKRGFTRPVRNQETGKPYNAVWFCV